MTVRFAGPVLVFVLVFVLVRVVSSLLGGLGVLALVGNLSPTADGQAALLRVKLDRRGDPPGVGGSGGVGGVGDGVGGHGVLTCPRRTARRVTPAQPRVARAGQWAAAGSVIIVRRWAARAYAASPPPPTPRQNTKHNTKHNKWNRDNICR